MAESATGKRVMVADVGQQSSSLHFFEDQGFLYLIVDQRWGSLNLFTTVSLFQKVRP